MKVLSGNYYVKLKLKRYLIHPTENIILRKRDPPKYLRTQYQVQNNTQMRKTQKVIKNDNDELIVKNYPKKKQPIIQQPKYEPPNCPSIKRNLWLDFDKSYYCMYCGYIINKQNYQIHKKILRQDHYFSTRLPYANKEFRELYYSMANTTYNSSKDMINKLQSLKGKAKLCFLEKF